MDPNLKRKAPGTPSEVQSDRRPPCPACQDRGLIRRTTHGCVFCAAYPPDLHPYFPLLKKFYGLAQVEKLLSEIPETHHRQSFLRNLITDAEAREAFLPGGISFVDTIGALSRQIKLLQKECEDSLWCQQGIDPQKRKTTSSSILKSPIVGHELQHIADTLEGISRRARG